MQSIRSLRYSVRVSGAPRYSVGESKVLGYRCEVSEPLHGVHVEFKVP
jgi:hypothetical protein